MKLCMLWAWIGVYHQSSNHNQGFVENPMYFAPQNNSIEVMWLKWCHKWCCAYRNDITSMKFLIKGAMGIFLDTQQHFRPDSLAAYVIIASQVIRHSLSHFKLQ